MDLMKEFEEYLPIWSEEKHQPIPTMKHMDRWSVAWIDFVNEYLVKKKSELISDYRSMEFKTRGEAEAEQQASEEEEIEEVEEVVDVVEEDAEPVVDEHPKDKSEWEKVRAMLYGE